VTTVDRTVPDVPPETAIRSTSVNPAGSGADVFDGTPPSRWKTM
jgi:hypothetical protein